MSATTDDRTGPIRWSRRCCTRRLFLVGQLELGRGEEQEERERLREEVKSQERDVAQART